MRTGVEKGKVKEIEKRKKEGKWCKRKGK